MSQIIPKTSLASLEEKKDRPKKRKFILYKIGNEHLVLMFVCSSDTISVVDENKKTCHKHASEAFIYIRKKAHEDISTGVVGL